MITCSHTTCEYYRKNRTSHCFVKQATVKNCERRIEAKNRKRRLYMKKYMRMYRKMELLEKVVV